MVVNTLRSWLPTIPRRSECGTSVGDLGADDLGADKAAAGEDDCSGFRWWSLLLLDVLNVYVVTKCTQIVSKKMLVKILSNFEHILFPIIETLFISYF